MGVREKLNQHPGYTSGGAIAIIVLALVVVFWSIHRGKPALLHDAFYTDDGGQTYFEAANTNIAPFDHNGKEAVQAYVYSWPHGKDFVMYMTKYPPELKKILDDKVAHGQPPFAKGTVMVRVGPGRQLPGVDPSAWYDADSPEGHKIQSDITNPDGSTAGMNIVLAD